MDGLVLVELTLYTNVTCANINLLLLSNHHLTAHECDYYTFIPGHTFIHFSYSKTPIDETRRHRCPKIGTSISWLHLTHVSNASFLCNLDFLCLAL